MTIVHKAGNIHKNADGLSRWELPNTPENPAYVPTGAEPQIPIEGMKITDVGKEFLEESTESYRLDKNCHILTSLLEKDCKDSVLANYLDDIWKNLIRMLINTIILECHDNIYSGHLSEDRTMERIEACAWWPSWRKDVIEYCHRCDRCQKSNKATGKRFGLIIHIQEPSTPLEVVHMDWGTALPPGGDKR
ncbi:hypothetical protein O181_100554 [Austropuccinia psidii MF-1]|uniref:Integrase zinc-binding domain-containing protein n=1 Tax=Austropuccinia psidii MF-1 TaxID=1389203 RepID=A0A9Q3PGI2_9BASI|nr:hypothetical protein [Austropuccinia psidii MF-1]